MIEKTSKEFIDNAENLLLGVTANDDFVKIKTQAGNAVLVSESEWNVMVDAMRMLIAAQSKQMTNR